MFMPKPLSGDSSANTADAAVLASPTADGVNQLRNESLSDGQPSSQFLQLVRDVSQRSRAPKSDAAPSSVENARASDDQTGSADRQPQTTEQFAGLAVRRVHGPHANLGVASEAAASNKAIATVYGDGTTTISLTDGKSVAADPDSGSISLNSDAGAYESDGSGNFFFKDKDGQRKQIDQANAAQFGAQLEDGSLTVGPYRFEGHRLSMPDGGSVLAEGGHVHARLHSAAGDKGDVSIEASGQMSVVSADGGSQSLVVGDDVFSMDGHGNFQHRKLTAKAAAEFDPGVPDLRLDNGNKASSAGKKESHGGVPIREAMMTLFGLADSLRGQTEITPWQFDALQAAAADLGSAAVACKGMQNWAELRFVNGVNSAINNYLSHVGIKADGTPLTGQYQTLPADRQLVPMAPDLAEKATDPKAPSKLRQPVNGFDQDFLPPLRLDTPNGMWAEPQSHATKDPLTLTRTRFDNPGMLSDSAINDASSVIPIEKAYVEADDGWVATPSTNHPDQISIERADTSRFNKAGLGREAPIVDARGDSNNEKGT